LSFKCDTRALIPRPETELLVTKAIEAGLKLEGNYGRPLKVLDLCCGTGCLGIALAIEKPHWQITLADISTDALELCCINANNLLSGRPNTVSILQSDLFSDITGKFDIITANPPYLTPQETRDCLDLGWKEPSLALDGGEVGLGIIKRLIEQAASRLEDDGILLLEAAPHQDREIQKLIRDTGFETSGPWKDLTGHLRVWGGNRKFNQIPESESAETHPLRE